MKKKITLQIDLGSKLLIGFVGAGLWIIALKPITNTSQAQSSDWDTEQRERKEQYEKQDKESSFGRTGIFNSAASSRKSENYDRPAHTGSQSYNTVGSRSSNVERIAPPPWNSLGSNQMLIESELPNLMRDYGYSRMEAYCHFILWEVSALERRMRE